MTTGPAAHVRKKQPLMWRILSILPPLMLLLAILTLLYPVVATLQNNARQQRIADEYSAEMINLGPDALAEDLAAADLYNSTLAEAPILDPWLDAQRPDTDAYRAYRAQLALNDVMGQVVIPKIHADLPIYHGTTNDVLAKGIGHLFGTALPVGGTSTHAVLTGHTGLGNATLFDNLVDLESGDVFYLHVDGRYLKYEINDIRVVLPNETDSLNKIPGRDLVTLITCTPYGVNSHRLLVTGERVAIDPIAAAAETAEATPTPMQPWMIGVLVGVGAIILIALIVSIRWFIAGRHRDREQKRADAQRSRELFGERDGAEDRGAPDSARARRKPGAGYMPKH